MTWKKLIELLQTIPADRQDNPAIINEGTNILGLETDEQSGDYYLDTDAAEVEE